MRFVIIQKVGKFFTVDISIKNDHQLKTDGFYKLSRCPSYTFAILTFVGLGLTLNNWLSFFCGYFMIYSLFLPYFC
ncbi:isoprenylcysteine carboxylmethyltransferase family protein [Chryseobacterium sp. TY4]